jgi:hypothetical protein
LMSSAFAAFSLVSPITKILISFCKQNKN